MASVHEISGATEADDAYYCDGRVLVVPARPAAPSERSTQLTLRAPGGKKQWLTTAIDSAACAAGSAYFAAMVDETSFREGRSQTWELQDVDCGPGFSVLRYLHGELNTFDRDELVDTYLVADRWQVDVLRVACTQALAEQVDATTLGGLWSRVMAAGEPAVPLQRALSNAAWAWGLAPPSADALLARPDEEVFLVQRQRMVAGNEGSAWDLHGRWFVPACLRDLTAGWSPKWKGPDEALILRRSLSNDGARVTFTADAAFQTPDAACGTRFKDRQLWQHISFDTTVATGLSESSRCRRKNIELTRRADSAEPWTFTLQLEKCNFDRRDLSSEGPFAANGDQHLSFSIAARIAEGQLSGFVADAWSSDDEVSAQQVPAAPVQQRAYDFAPMPAAPYQGGMYAAPAPAADYENEVRNRY